MTTIYEYAYAKINLTLDVLGKRADGYHDLKSVMQTISIRDDVRIDLGTGEPWRLSCTMEAVPCNEKNLAWKAARVFFDAIDKDPDGLSIHITKRIPMEAGLGGGSADAAAVLRALNSHYAKPFSMGALAELGAQVGSDVPFCVLCGTAMAEGRGEKLRRLPDLPDCVFVVVKPDFSVSTPVLFRRIDDVAIYQHPDNSAMEHALLAGDLPGVCRNVYNVFDPVVTAEHPELNTIKSIFHSCGAAACQMTGSGSAVFAIVQESGAAEEILGMLKENYSQVFLAKPI